jgi:hypothetical protein
MKANEQWMLIMTSVCLSIWGCGFCCMFQDNMDYADTLDMKHKYGYMEIPGAGIFSVPPDLFSSRDRNFVKVFNEAVTCEVSSSFNC